MSTHVDDLQVREPLGRGIAEHMIQDVRYRATPVGRTYFDMEETTSRFL